MRRVTSLTGISGSLSMAFAAAMSSSFKVQGRLLSLPRSRLGLQLLTASFWLPHPTRPHTNAPTANPTANNTVATTMMEGPAGVSQASEASEAAGGAVALPTRVFTQPGPQADIAPRSADGPATRPAAPSGKEPEPRPAEAGRRRLTVMFLRPGRLDGTTGEARSPYRARPGSANHE